jgi:hypothetical protein
MSKTIMLAAMALVASLMMVPAPAYASGICVSGSTVDALIAQGACTFGGAGSTDFTLTFSVVGFSGSPVSPGNTQTTIQQNTNVTLSSASVTNLVVSFLATYTALDSSNATLNYHYSVQNTAFAYGLTANDYTIQNAFVGAAGVASITGFKEVTGAGVAHQTDVASSFADGQFHDLTGSLAYAPIVIADIEDSLTLQQHVGGFTPGTAMVGDAIHQGALINNLTFVAVPEPVTIFVTGLGLLAFGFSRRRLKS